MKPEFINSYITLMKSTLIYRQGRIFDPDSEHTYSSTIDHLLTLTAASDIRSVDHALAVAKSEIPFLLSRLPKVDFFKSSRKYTMMAINDTLDIINSMRRFEGIQLHTPTSHSLAGNF